MLQLYSKQPHLDKDQGPNFLHPQAYKMQYKASTNSTKFLKKMAAIAPVSIGTRGTVGSLVRKEIEHFGKLETDPCGSSQKPQGQIVDVASTSGHSRPSFWLLLMTWKRKKGRGTGSHLPNMCSVVEVAERKRLNRIPGYNYRILKNNLHI